MSAEEIQLTRGPSGLGFNIVGGTDQPYISDDPGIFVSSIKEKGAAAIDGRLQEGDRILEVNGMKLENLLHGEAVSLFRNAGEHVALNVHHKVQNQPNGVPSSHNDGDSGGISLAMILLPALIIFAGYAFFRYRQSFK